jgi:type II secretory pathway pseudopilin PulG
MRHKTRGSEEEGATLIIVLVFVMFIGLIIAAVLGLSGSDLLTTAKLQDQRSQEYSADGVAETLLQTARYETPAQTDHLCGSTFTLPPSMNGVTNLVAYCQVANLLPQRTLTFAVCLSSATNLATCQSAPNSLLQATVIISDLSSSCPSYSGRACNAPGTSVTIQNWMVTKASG